MDVGVWLHRGPGSVGFRNHVLIREACSLCAVRRLSGVTISYSAPNQLLFSSFSAPIQLACWSYSVHIRLLSGSYSAPDRIPFSSSSVPTQFLFSSYSVPIQFPSSSYSASVQFIFSSYPALFQLLFGSHSFLLHLLLRSYSAPVQLLFSSYSARILLQKTPQHPTHISKHNQLFHMMNEENLQDNLARTTYVRTTACEHTHILGHTHTGTHRVAAHLNDEETLPDEAVPLKDWLTELPV
jgi:hypothetical protein